VPFIQIIEFRTSQLAEVESVMDEWVIATEGRRSAGRSNLTADKDQPDTYVQIVEFPSYEQAMANSSMPETSQFSERLFKLCEGPPTFRNLDVVRTDQMS
jgi:quinol monooxygenase YgiN